MRQRIRAAFYRKKYREAMSELESMKLMHERTIWDLKEKYRRSMVDGHRDWIKWKEDKSKFELLWLETRRHSNRMHREMDELKLKHNVAMGELAQKYANLAARLVEVLGAT